MSPIIKNFGGLFRLFPVMPGAGIAKTYAHVEHLVRNTDISIIILGSITVEQRMGNPGNQFYADPDGAFTVNSVGMTNSGKVEYQKMLPKIIELVHKAGKKLVVSIAAVKNYTEYAELYQMCQDAGVDAVELNFGCPNVWDEGKPHAPVSFSPEDIKQILNHMKHTIPSIKTPVWVKISPIIPTPTTIREIGFSNAPLQEFVDKKLLRNIVLAVQLFYFVKAVVSTNTVGQVRVLDEHGATVLGPNPQNPSGTGGLAGRAIHAISLEQAEILRRALPSWIDLICAGGVEDGQSMKDFIDRGAIAVQVVSKYWEKNDPAIFSNIAAEYVGLLE